MVASDATDHIERPIEQPIKGTTKRFIHRYASFPTEHSLGRITEDGNERFPNCAADCFTSRTPETHEGGRSECSAGNPARYVWFPYV